MLWFVGSCLAGLPVFLRLPGGSGSRGKTHRKAAVSEVERLEGPQRDGRDGSVLSSVSNAMVALHKEQFGRGPVRARTTFSDDDTLVCTLQDALLPAEQALVEIGHQERVQEARMFFQMATRDKFIAAVEEITGRTVVAFSSATDPGAAVVWEIFRLQPSDARTT